ncbi:MAG: four helix bundle protein [Prevotella sp.]|nr:four helix bundle protein [Prevotella sp.]
MTRTYEDIYAWQKAHQFVLMVYRVCKNFPEFEKYGLASQFQRAAVSVTANIAEGYRKISQADKLRFLNISQGSLEECRYYCLLAKDLGYINADVYENLRASVNETSLLLNSYIKGILNNKYRSAMD